MSTDDRPNISRRSFILTVLSSLAAASALEGCGTSWDSESITRQLSATISDHTAAKRFGAAYLLDHPDESGLETLVQHIDVRLSSQYGQGMDTDNQQLLARHLEQLIRDEYRQGEAVQVDGWILSRTEARLYALFALP